MVAPVQPSVLTARPAQLVQIARATTAILMVSARPQHASILGRTAMKPMSTAVALVLRSAPMARPAQLEPIARAALALEEHVVSSILPAS